MPRLFRRAWDCSPLPWSCTTETPSASDYTAPKVVGKMWGAGVSRVSSGPWCPVPRRAVSYGGPSLSWVALVPREARWRWVPDIPQPPWRPPPPPLSTRWKAHRTYPSSGHRPDRRLWPSLSSGSPWTRSGRTWGWSRTPARPRSYLWPGYWSWVFGRACPWSGDSSPPRTCYPRQTWGASWGTHHKDEPHTSHWTIRQRAAPAGGGEDEGTPGRRRQS